METSEQNNSQNLTWWITSLAISITCCAVLFVIFAGYLADINKSIAIENIRLEEMAEHETQLLSEIQFLRRTAANNVQAAPTPVPTASVEPMSATSSVVPTGTSAPTALTAPITVPTSSSVSTPAAPVAPTAVPEVPASH